MCVSNTPISSLLGPLVPSIQHAFPVTAFNDGQAGSPEEAVAGSGGLTKWESGYPPVCKTGHAGPNPAFVSNESRAGLVQRRLAKSKSAGSIPVALSVHVWPNGLGTGLPNQTRGFNSLRVFHAVVVQSEGSLIGIE